MYRLRLWVMALAAGLVVANNYYNQPLLGELASAFNVPAQAAGAVAALTQFGYALGMLLLLPLGDTFERRRLILIMLGCSSVALIAFAQAPTFEWLVALGFLIGFTSIVPQILPPLAAQLAGPGQAAEAVGLVLGGLLLGILLSRFVAGQLGAWLGWQGLYYAASAVMVGLMVVLRAVLPASPPRFTGTYLQALASLGRLYRDHRLLRITSLAGALQFGAFSLFWTTLALHLGVLYPGHGARYAGWFSLVGAGGALAAPLAGKLAGRIPARRILLASGALMVLAFMIYALGGRHWAWLVPGVVLMDLGMQVSHVSSMSRNYELDASAVSRLNTVYMVIRFVGGAVGTVIGAQAWHLAGWPGVSAAGASLCLMAVAVQARLRQPPPPGPDPAAPTMSTRHDR